MLTVLGIHRSIKNGITNTTLHVASEFPSYYNDKEAGRTSEGSMCQSIYVGSYDCSKILINSQIDILYDRAITTSKGTYQPIKCIDILSSK